MRLAAALQGDLKKIMADEVAALDRGAYEAVSAATVQTQERQRHAVRSAGLGDRLPKSWRSRVYRNHDHDAAGLVWTKAAKIVAAHAQGAGISAKRGRFLAIPTEHVPVKSNFEGKYSPGNWPEGRFGPLAYVPARGRRPALLVAQGLRQTKRGKFTKATSKRALATGEGTSTVVMFILLSRVQLKRLPELDLDAAAEQATRALLVSLQQRYVNAP